MSEGKKILIFVVLMVGSSLGFMASEKTGNPAVTNFFAIASVGLLIAIVAGLLSRSESRRG